VEPLARCDPAGLGLKITHGSTRRLAEVAAERGIRPRLAHSTVSLIWREADWQPHRYRYWRTPTLNAEFQERASRVLPELLAPFRQWRRVPLIWDGGPGHISATTRAFLRSYGSWLRVLVTPAHASGLHQAELLLRSFEVRYLRRGSRVSRQELIDYLYASMSEYNRLFAHPINWSWTRRKTTGLC